MRTAILISLFTLGITSCQTYRAVENSGADRLWIITKDGTEVFRCWDLKNQTGKSIAICRHAEMLGKSETTPWSELADRTAHLASANATEATPLPPHQPTPSSKPAYLVR